MSLLTKLKKWLFHGLIVKGVVFFITAVICLFVISYMRNHTVTSVSTSSEASKEITRRPVSVTNVIPQEFRASVRVLGEVVPEWQTTLRAQVAGAIVGISKRLKPGTTVRKGERLITLDKSEYLVRVAEAEGRLAGANVNQLKEEHEAKEAQLNWQRSGLKGEPESALVLRQPQLEAAKGEVKAAQRALDRAKKELEYTSIRAPFNGLIVHRNVDLGESLLAGDEVAIIYGTEKAEISVHLDAKQWSLLPDRWNGIKATLRDPSRGVSWDAVVVREGGHLDRKSRLRTLYLEVSRPYELTPPLLPGTFVQVDLPGRKVPRLLRLPESALTRKGLVWYVDETPTLRNFMAEPVFYGAGDVFLSPPDEAPFPLRVAVSPTTSFTAGLNVKPIAVKPKD